MSYQRLNVITGWLLFIVASTVYYLTLEPTMPFWDCGEFIASAYKLEVGHPPGAPLFMLIARLFSAFVSPDQVPFMINMLSALASGATIMFLHWTITHMAKKFVVTEVDPTSGRLWAVLGSGIIGGLAYTFSDTFWFSAVEGEVYAMSSLFTALVFWAILKWEAVVDRTGSLRWLVLIAYLMGLSIGVHLLNLLAIPAICLVYYYKNYEVTKKGLIWTGLVSLGLLALIQTGIIIWFVKLAGFFERIFVNSFGMPFNSGTIFYALLLIALITFGLVYSHKKGKLALNTLIISVAVAIIGYTSFATVVIRSHANTPMDENNPENIFALLSYLNREQYGERPLLTGQYFNTPEAKDDPSTDQNETYSDGAYVWVKSYSVREDNTKEKIVLSCREKFEAEKYISEHPQEKLKIVQEYIESGEKKGSVVNYDKNYSTVFPRMYSSQANHIADYKQWSNYKGYQTVKGREKVKELEQSIKELEGENQQIIYYLTRGKEQLSAEDNAQLRQRLKGNERSLQKKYEEAMPSKSEDIRFFISYQISWMYWRYFMWNFAGRQNDYQGHGDFVDGNWISGIKAIDSDRLGNQDQLSEIQLNNKGRNMYFFLPLILGCIGLVFQLMRNTKDFSVVALLFLLTGFAILIYLNQTPQQPRERDYAYAGSFYAFAIWIGLGVYAIYDAARNMTWVGLGKLSAMTVGGSVVIYVVEGLFSGTHSFGMSLIFISAVSSIMLAIMTALKGAGNDASWKGIVAMLLCVPAPYLMAKDGWDDHTRANRRTGVDMAWNYLQSLQPNGIIFTNGDNDTFPLWYAQEVEGTRTDVRVVNLSLLNTDWYIDDMKRRAYDGAPVPFTMPEQKYRQGTRDVLFVDPYNEADKKGYMPLQDALNFCLDDKNNIENGKKMVSYLPTYKLTLKIDSAVVESYRPFLQAGDSLAYEFKFQLADDRGRPKTYITKAQLLQLDLLAHMDWNRPLYFAVTTGGDAYLGLERYFQLEGLAYRLTPILHKKSDNPNLDGGVGTELMFDNMMNKFRWGNMDNGDLYMDENNRRMTSNLRLQFSHLADELIQEKKKDQAVQVLDKCMAVMPEKNVPYDQTQIMWRLSELYYDAGDSVKALQLSKRLIDLSRQELSYYSSLDPERQAILTKDMSLKARILDRLVAQAELHFPNDPEVQKMAEENNAYFTEEVLSDFEINPMEREMVRKPQQSSPVPAQPTQPAKRDTTRVQIDDKGITTKPKK